MPISGIWGKTNSITSNTVGSWAYYNGSWMRNSTGYTNGSYFIEGDGAYSFYPSASALQNRNTSFNLDTNPGLRYWTASLNAQTVNDETGVNTSYYGGTVYITMHQKSNRSILRRNPTFVRSGAFRSIISPAKSTKNKLCIRVQIGL